MTMTMTNLKRKKTKRSQCQGLSVKLVMPPLSEGTGIVPHGALRVSETLCQDFLEKYVPISHWLSAQDKNSQRHCVVSQVLRDHPSLNPLLHHRILHGVRHSSVRGDGLWCMVSVCTAVSSSYPAYSKSGTVHLSAPAQYYAVGAPYLAALACQTHLIQEAILVVQSKGHCQSLPVISYLMKIVVCCSCRQRVA